MAPFAHGPGNSIVRLPSVVGGGSAEPFVVLVARRSPGIVPGRVREEGHECPVEVEPVTLPLAAGVSGVSEVGQNVANVALGNDGLCGECLTIGEGEFDAAVRMPGGAPVAFVESVVVVRAHE